MSNTSPSRVSAPPRAVRWSSLAFAACLTGLAALSLAACGEDTPAPATTPDAGPQAACKPSDCASQPQPRVADCPGGTAQHTCGREPPSVRCQWILPRCSTPNDAGSDASGDVTSSEAGSETGGETGDFVDAPISADAGADASSD